MINAKKKELLGDAPKGEAAKKKKPAAKPVEEKKEEIKEGEVPQVTTGKSILELAGRDMKST